MFAYKQVKKVLFGQPMANIKDFFATWVIETWPQLTVEEVDRLLQFPHVSGVLHRDGVVDDDEVSTTPCYATAGHADAIEPSARGRPKLKCTILPSFDARRKDFAVSGGLHHSAALVNDISRDIFAVCSDNDF